MDLSVWWAAVTHQTTLHAHVTMPRRPYHGTDPSALQSQSPQHLQVVQLCCRVLKYAVQYSTQTFFLCVSSNQMLYWLQ